jgi:hypothetical protein
VGEYNGQTGLHSSLPLVVQLLCCLPLSPPLPMPCVFRGQASTLARSTHLQSQLEALTQTNNYLRENNAVLQAESQRYLTRANAAEKAHQDLSATLAPLQERLLIIEAEKSVRVLLCSALLCSAVLCFARVHITVALPCRFGSTSGPVWSGRTPPCLRAWPVCWSVTTLQTPRSTVLPWPASRPWRTKPGPHRTKPGPRRSWHGALRPSLRRCRPPLQRKSRCVCVVGGVGWRAFLCVVVSFFRVVVVCVWGGGAGVGCGAG